uniref:Nucleolar protein 4 like n=1 Tax=Accipiter nisus TaxID=211598 RepID=A0A8B9M9P8_9AVES
MPGRVAAHPPPPLIPRPYRAVPSRAAGRAFSRLSSRRPALDIVSSSGRKGPPRPSTMCSSRRGSPRPPPGATASPPPPPPPPPYTPPPPPPPGAGSDALRSAGPSPRAAAGCQPLRSAASPGPLPPSLRPSVPPPRSPSRAAGLAQAGRPKAPLQDETSVSSEDFDMNDSTWISADQHLNSSLSPSQDESMRSPQNLHGHEDDDSSSESCSGNGSSTLNPSTSSSTQGDSAFPEMNGNGTAAPMDFTTSADDQPINLCDKLAPAHVTPSYQSDSCSADGLRSRVKYAVKTTAESPPYSSGSYDSIKTEVSGCPEDLTVGRAPTADEDDDDHDDHEDNDKINDSEGMDPERLKAFNMFVRLFVDENLDRMVPISKQPKEKIQAIIESCSRQFPEFQERARKRIRTYLKSCRRMKKNGMEMTRPTPPHLTSAMAENILAAACESETRKAAKRMRLEIYQTSQDEPIALDKQHSRDSTAITHSSYSLPASSYSQDPVYINGSLNYSYRGYGSLGGSLQPPASLQTGNHSNGPTDLSMKGGASSTAPSNSTSRGMQAAQLSPTEISAVRQLIAGYRESAAFLLRSADELENLILQQN